ncbi:MAG TPA: UvrD-helicase domain-containing protein [Vicinamibacterales bacterium]|nr:UvrD-helicase domain-containing protein [Vicinamibacterales bacterium]
MDLVSALNPAQRAAVEHTSGPLLILAGAGSGKTRVITHRIAYLIQERHAEPGQVLAVTFTNKAAEEMRTRVEQLVGEDCRQIWLSTFHSLCARLLRREAPAINLTRDFVIYDSSDQIAVVKQAMKVLDIDDKLIQPRAALSRISQAKNRMETPEDVKNTGGSLRDRQIARIYESYRRVLTDAGALDFDDLLLKTVELVETNERARTYYAHKFKHVMVDEYQDTNRPQYLLMKRLAEVHRNLCVVGDPDQSIYKWRGADLRNILDFEYDFPDATIVKLEQNYRSTQVILDAATAVISRNRNRKDKRLWTDTAGGARIRYMRAGDEIEEADFITRTARESERQRPDAMLAILYRTNAQSRAIEDALMRDGVAYRIIGGVRFYERKEIKDVLAYLRLLINPHDDVSFRRVVNVPARGIGKSVLESLEAIEPEASHEHTPLLAIGLDAKATPRSMWSRLLAAIDRRALPQRAATALKGFRDLITNLVAEAGQSTVSIAIGLVLDRTGYLQSLRDERNEEAEGRIENLMELVSAAREYESRDDEASLGGFVDRLSLLSEADEADGAREARVWMMTMHAAKGLEFPTVVVAGMEEGLFPHSRAAEDEDDVEEERRLCYVCLTRARERLVLTGASRRRVFGEYQSTEPSRFLEEVPEELVERLESAPSPRWQTSPYELRNPYGRGGHGGRRSKAREETTYAYEDEDQSVIGVRVGMRVRHRQFGVGTVVAVEDQGDDIKVTVRFAAVGTKKLLARFANLEPA